jgi:hypothetical protein
MNESKPIPVKKLVENELRDRISTRNSDMTLCYYVYRKLGVNPDTTTTTQLLFKISQGEVPPPDSLTRYRRMLQEEYPSLRGSNYEARARKEKQIVDQLRGGEEVLLP